MTIRLCISVFLTLFLFEAPAFACRCTSPDVGIAWQRIDMVVRVTVDDVVPMPSGEGSTAVVSVKASWKTSSPARLIINTFTSCAFNWKTGGEYILFLIKESNGLYSTDRCVGSRLANDLKAIQWLNQHGKKMQVFKPVY